jgi:hypothetical protein
VPPVPPAPPVPPLPGIPLDWNYLLSQRAPFLVFAVVAVLGGLVARWFFRSPVAEAIAERIRAGTRGRYGQSGATAEVDAERVALLEQQLAALHTQLSELAERVDFAERMLAERRERRLSAGQ